MLNKFFAFQAVKIRHPIAIWHMPHLFPLSWDVIYNGVKEKIG